MQKQNENKVKETKLKTSRFIKPALIASAIIVVGVILYLVLSPTQMNDTDTEYMFKKEGELTFTDTLGNKKVKLDIEIADTDFDRQLGLMFRKQMNENNGILFIFSLEELQSFWMRNTFISLDLIFVNTAKKIVTIHSNTATLSDQSYPSSAPALYVIEVNAGYTQAHNIHEGDKIDFIELTKSN